jgi:3'-5' exoribonuclease
MNNKQFINELRENEQVESPFLIKEKNLLNFRSIKGKYLHVLLGDRSGEMEGRMWDNAEELDKLFHNGEIVFVNGSVVSYQDSLQIKIEGLRKVSANEVDFSCFVAESSRPINEMHEEFMAMVANMKQGPLHDLICNFFDSKHYKIFFTAPAAKKFHQNYRGGLMEHTLGVAQICLKIADLHKDIDQDLILTGAIFHDIGKTQEMAFSPGIEYTDAGKLLGHIVLGIQIVDDLIKRTPGIDTELRNQLLHMIVSHHGEYQWQSPKKPKFLEAKVLHLADMMDAEIWKFKSANPSRDGSSWSDYMRIIGNEVYLKNRTNGN